MKGKGILIKQNEVSVIEFKDNLEYYYEQLEVSLIDIVSKVVGGVDLGVRRVIKRLLKENPVPSALSNNQIALVGNLLVCKYAGNGELKGFTDENEISIIKENIYKCFFETNDGLIISNCLKIE